LKRLALSARVVPSETHPQPPYAEPLPIQVEEGLAIVTVVKESAAPPHPAAANAVEEERAVEETAAHQAALAPPAGDGSGGEDEVMVPADDGGSAPSFPVRGHDVATSTTPESSAVVTATSIEGATDASTSWYLDFPGIGIIDRDATKIPSNDREILEAVTKQVFADL
jgi:hypothetical protein